MTTAINPVRLSCYESNNVILHGVPDDITLRILRTLKSLIDVNSFLARNHSSLKLRSSIWLDWARRYGYDGDEKECQKYLTNFFSCVAKDITTNSQTSMKNGYLIAEKILNSPHTELSNLLTQVWPYRSPKILFLVEQAAGALFPSILNSNHVIKELLIPAARDGDLEKIRKFCPMIKNPNLADNEFTPMHAAAEADQGKAIKILSEYGAKIDSIWIRTERYTEIRSSRARGVYSVTYTVDFYDSPLNVAYDGNRRNAVKALLQAGVDPGPKFIDCCRKAHLNMLRVFLEVSASKLDLNKGLGTCFIQLRHDNSTLPRFELLLEYGASPNITNKQGKTQLYRLVREANVLFVQTYCKYKADTELRTNKGKSPLYAAIKSSKSKTKRMEIIRILCAHGADIHAIDHKGKKTILEHAKEHKKIYQLLLEIQDKRLNNLFTP